MKETKKILARITELLDQDHLSHAWLSRATEIPVTTISGYFRIPRMPGTRNLMKIAKALDVPLEYLVTGFSMMDNFQEEEELRTKSFFKKMRDYLKK